MIVDARVTAARPRSSPAGGLRRPITVALLTAVVAAGGCAEGGAGGGTTRPAPGPPSIDAGETGRLLNTYNARIARLQRIAARGVLEFRWVDEQGNEHFEPQINARLWIELPRRTALQGEKLGDVYLWLGSDDDRYWMFDLTSEVGRLHVGRHDADVSATPEAAPFLVAPLALIDLLGLTPLPVFADPTGADAVRFEPTDDPGVVTVEARGSGGPMRVHLARADGLPRRVDTLDAAGEMLLSSRLGRYESVEIAGQSAVARPRLATLIDITSPDGSIAVKLALGRASDETMDRVFDLDRLVEHLRPDEIVEADGDEPD